MRKNKIPVDSISNIDIGNFCNCMATRHQFLYNCISCGLILCDKNKNIKSDIIYCPFCSNLITLPMSADDVNNLVNTILLFTY